MRTCTRIRASLFLLLTLLTGDAFAAGSDDWPQWRGPDHNGSVSGHGIFAAPSFGLELVWQRPLGPGYSSLSIVGDRVVTLFAEGEHSYLAAFATETGAELWRYRVDAVYRGHDGSEDGPMGTPTIADGVVYGLGRRGDLFAVRLADGTPLWTRQIVETDGARKPYHGFSTVPLVVDDVLVLETGGDAGHSLSGFDRRSGQLLWSHGDDEVGYQSPIVASFGGRRQVVAVSNRLITGLDPTTGEKLWQHQHVEDGEQGAGSHPVLVGDDGILLTYWDDAALFRVTASATGTTVQESWRTNAFKRNYAVPVVYGEHLYGFNGAFLNCVEAATGKEVWKSRPPGGEGLILVDGHLVTFSPGGLVVVAEASPAGYREKARLKLAERAGYTPPSFAGGRVYVRNQEIVASVRVTAEAPAMAAAPTRIEPEAPPQGMLAELVRQLETAADKAAVVDAFLARSPESPIVEDTTLADGSPGKLVHLVWRGPAQDLVVRGNLTPEAEPQPLQRIAGTDLAYRTYALPLGGRWDYGFVVDYAEQPTPDPRNPRRIETLRGERSEVVLPPWQPPAHLSPPAQTRGRLEEFKFGSGDKERQVQVYLPPGYDAGDARYPLLVVTHGDEALRLGLFQHSLDNLIGERVAPVVVAFVSPLNFWEIGGTDTPAYAQMLAEELVPELDRRYRTQATAASRAILGNSRGALGALYTTLRHPGVFSKVGMQSLVLGTDLDDETLALVRRPEEQPLTVYLEWSRYEPRSQEDRLDRAAENQRVAAALREKGYVLAGGEVIDGPSWGSWRTRHDRLLELFFPLTPAAP